MSAFSFPVALELAGRRCVVVGDDETAEARVDALLHAGARVTVVGDEPGPVLRELEAAGRVRLRRRPYRRGDLRGAFLAVAATGDASLNARIFAEAERRRVLLNAVDDVGHCHFAVPSILRRGDLIVAVSTGGKCPGLARRLREALAREVGPEYGVLVDLLGDVRREMLAQRTVAPATWARRWRHALDHDLIELVRQGRLREVKAIVHAALSRDRPEEAVACRDRCPHRYSRLRGPPPHPR
jgi:siroheme synthase-like protein